MRSCHLAQSRLNFASCVGVAIGRRLLPIHTRSEYRALFLNLRHQARAGTNATSTKDGLPLTSSLCRSPKTETPAGSVVRVIRRLEALRRGVRCFVITDRAMSHACCTCLYQTSCGRVVVLLLSAQYLVWVEVVVVVVTVGEGQS